jgi:hypothetical protein
MHNVPSQLEMSLAWLEYHQNMDVAAAGLMVGVVDQTFMYTILPDQKRLDELTPYMRENRLSFFRDTRSSWVGRNLRDVFPKVQRGCEGMISGVTSLEHGGFRLDGSIEVSEVPFPSGRKIVVADAAGKIEGLGNSVMQRQSSHGTKFAAYVYAPDRLGFVPYLVISDRVACQLLPQSPPKISSLE